MERAPEIVLQADYSRYDYSSMCKPLAHALMPMYRPLCWLLAILFVPAIIMVEYGRRWDEPAWTLMGGPLLIVVSLAYLALTFYRARLNWRAVQEAPSRQGVTTLSMDEGGIDFTGAGNSTRLDWSVMVDVIDGPDGGLIVRTSGVEGVPIPATAIPEGMTPESLKARIAGWIAAAYGGLASGPAVG